MIDDIIEKVMAHNDSICIYRGSVPGSCKLACIWFENIAILWNSISSIVVTGDSRQTFYITVSLWIVHIPLS